MEKRFEYEVIVRQVGGSMYFAIPIQMMKYLDIKLGTKLKLIPDNSKYGPYMGVWNPKQQK